ncbi:uncharacterized protein [Physcomitrium patens]|uniref:Glycosyl hydrolase family 32 N-terminal domain-containing protein n=1 Tax=Physcomitrium patens TaxID=3218 RepID=A0A2K1KJP8_PHYPA|nr:uncharacterized protein LOC112282368 [Physcomitrium patens]XP_024375654.1 uncharacterized protein LOC112282368 [Physcomitrium patens]XP_024375655.1 uncharacterized protein LOC112282368 [Physcomitrium patens]PNR54007.1 hypothetical protein PHYPA_007683 [Physcomitrium patens]|eukprot:XP_024375653.1 uncharacterized protein LOC112282368 [Physcomitrella patens]
MGSISSLSVSSYISPTLHVKALECRSEAQIEGFIRAFQYPCKVLECQHTQRLFAAGIDVKTLTSSRKSSSRIAVVGQRGSDASQEPGNNESQAKLQENGNPSSDEASTIEPSRALAGQETPSIESSDWRGQSELEHEGLVISSGDSDAWDNGRVGSPIVRRYVSDNEERWCMWYSGENVDESLGTRVGIAISSNGMHWRRGKSKVDTEGQGEDGAVGLVLDRSENWWAFDTQHLYPSDVLIMSSAKVRAASGVYWLYYSGADAEEMSLPSSAISATPPSHERFFRGRMRPGLAISNDGRNWARVEGDHHSGALFDVGAEGEWDSLLIAAPQVVFHEAGDIRMYYHSLDPNTGKYSVGFARSRDAMRWLKFGKILEGGGPGSFDEFGIAARHVVPNPNGSGYLMVYEGIGANGRTSVGMAKSAAGLLNWERCQDEPIFRPADSEQAWDGAGVGSPCLVHMDGDEWRLYYVGVNARGETAIGMAMNVEGSLTEFKRWHNSTQI